MNLTPPKEMVQPTDPIPPIAIGFDNDLMLARIVRMAVILRQEIDQQLARFGICPVQPGRKRHFTGCASRLCANRTQLLRQS